MNEQSRSAFIGAQLESLKQENSCEGFRDPVNLHSRIFGTSKEIAERYGRFDDLDFLILDDAPVNLCEEHFVCLLRELVDNAFRYSVHDTPVQIAWSNLGSAHRLMIRDEGKGMDADYVHALNSGAPLPGGLVSGHYIVRKVLSMYRTTVFVFSDSDLGSCFEIDFLR